MDAKLLDLLEQIAKAIAAQFGSNCEVVIHELSGKSAYSSIVASAATSREEIGNPGYPPARRKLAEHGISCGGYAARQLRNRDYEE